MHAHLTILKYYNAKFCQILATMEAGARGRVIIEDIDLDIMRAVLAFLYEALLQVPVACKVLVAAFTYDMGNLQHMCVDILFTLVNVKNVVNILEVVQISGKNQLKDLCWDVVT